MTLRRWLLAPLCFGLLVGPGTLAAKPKKEKKAAEVVTPPPPPPPTGPPPPASPLSAPPLNGAEAGAPLLQPPVSTDDLREFTRARTRFGLEADSSGVGLLDAAHEAALLDRLAADPRWRVTRWETGTTALYREQGPDGWTLSASGYRGAPGQRRSRVGLRFDPRPAGDVWLNPNLIIHGAPSSRVEGLAWPLSSGPLKGWSCSALVIDGPSGSLEVHELSPELDLQETAAAVRDLPPLIRAYASGTVAPGPPLRGEPSGGPPTLSAKMVDGELELRGRLNPGAPGWTWVRVLDPGQRPWLEAAVAAGSLERVGWSTDAAARFSLQGRLLLPAPPVGSTLEAWFVADGGGPPRLVVSAPIP